MSNQEPTPEMEPLFENKALRADTRDNMNFGQEALTGGAWEFSDKGVDFLTRYEGENQTEDQLLTVRDLGDGVLTVGYGSTDTNWPDLKLGDKITMEQAREMYKKDLAGFQDKANELLKDVDGVTQNKFDAVVSFLYNTGGNQSPKAIEALKRGDWDEFAFEAMSAERGVVKDEGKKSPGLINRRQDELAIMRGEPTAYTTKYRDTGYGQKWLKNKGLK